MLLFAPSLSCSRRLSLSLSLSLFVSLSLSLSLSLSPYPSLSLSLSLSSSLSLSLCKTKRHSSLHLCGDRVLPHRKMRLLLNLTAFLVFCPASSLRSPLLPLLHRPLHNLLLQFPHHFNSHRVRHTPHPVPLDVSRSEATSSPPLALVPDGGGVDLD